jgi:FAD/FMN-containing dehydrogenase
MAWLGVESPQNALEVLELFRASFERVLTGFELMNEHQVDLVIRHVPNRRCPLTDHSGWHVLVELSDTSDATTIDLAMQTVLQRALDHEFLKDAVIATNEAQRVAMWEFRHSVSEANKKGGVGLTTDCAVPISAVPSFIEEATRSVRAAVPELPIVIVSHLGDGNVHFIPFFSLEQWKRVENPDDFAQQIRNIVNQTAISLGGTFSAEHGVGRTLLADMAHYKSAIELSMMRAIKQAVDPKNLFNPGRLLP